MIAVSFNKDRYFYDVHSLVRAFYPGEEVSVFVRGEKDIRSSEGSISVDIGLYEDEGRIEAVIYRGDDRLAEKTRCIPAVPGKRESSIELEPVLDDTGIRLYNAKNALKRLLYRMLSEIRMSGLPWGSLTGIRPTHIPKVMMESGKTREEASWELRDTFFVSHEKAELALDIAQKEIEILGGDSFTEGYSLYIGIPFCPTTCLYCSFTSYPLAAWQGRVDGYLDVLEKEMECTAELFSGRRLFTVYVGGGTPTTLTPEQLDRLLSSLERYFDLSDLMELTVEAGRPDSITVEKLRVLRDHGVTRISINPQTMQQKTLELIGRRHTPEDVCRAFEAARSTGDFSINMDLILGLPGESAGDVSDTMDKIAALQPDDLTIHSLAIKRGSRMQALMETKNVTFPAFSEIEKAASTAALKAVEMGLEPYYLYRQKNIAGNYENTGYARRGHEGLYNILINGDVHSIAAVGAGAVSKCVRDDLVTRAENVKDLEQYLARIDEMIDRKRSLYKDIS